MPRVVPLLRDFPVNGDMADIPQRSLDDARAAYLRMDVEASRDAHLVPPRGKHHKEGHASASSSHVKAVVFGGLDGVVTIFAMVAGCVGAKLTPGQTMIVGVGNLLADAISMGFGEYVSAAAEADFVQSESARERWEVDNFPEGEKQEMLEIYTGKYGVNINDARTLTDIIFRYKDLCISHMMAEELGLIYDTKNAGSSSPFSRGLVMFAAFSAFGLMPLLAFSVWAFITGGTASLDQKGMHAFIAAAALSTFTLFTLGTIKAKFINQPAIKSGLQMMCNGAIASSIAYAVGSLLQKWANTGGSSSSLVA